MDKFVNYFMDVAEITSKLSHARRMKVGAVIVKDRNIISFGYNGMPSGMDNNCEDEVRNVYNDSTLTTKPEVIHAEANAICKLARQGNSGQDASMFITIAPCVECAKLIIQTGIKNVYYGQQYRDNTGLNLLHTTGIEAWEVPYEKTVQLP
jgi:dCMP deaminase